MIDITYIIKNYDNLLTDQCNPKDKSAPNWISEEKLLGLIYRPTVSDSERIKSPIKVIILSDNK